MRTGPNFLQGFGVGWTAEAATWLLGLYVPGLSSKVVCGDRQTSLELAVHEAEGLCPPPSAVWELRDFCDGS